MSARKGELTLYQGIGFLVSTLLGSGVFIVPAMVAAISGYHAWIPWLGMTILMLPVLFVFSWLGKEYPHAAGTAHFVRLAFGDRLSKCISILYLSVVPVGPPVVIITGANYLAFGFSLDSSAIPYFAIAMLVIILTINFFRISLAGNVQFLITIVTVLILGMVIYSGLFMNESGFRLFDKNTNLDIHAIARSMGVVFWCFVGIEAVTHISPEFRYPDRDFPKTVYISIFATVLLYSLLSYTVLNYSAFGSEETNIASLPSVIRQSFGDLGSTLIGFIGFVTCLGAVNLYIVSLARLLTSLGEDGTISTVFSKKNRNNSPIIAILFVLALIAITVLLKFAFQISMESIISSANGIFITIYLMASLSALRLLPGKRKVWGAFAGVFCLVVGICLREDMVYAAAVLVASLFITSSRRTNDRNVLRETGNPQSTDS